MRNTVRSRNSLRNKHIAQLEETKTSLNQIKNAASKQLANSKSDQDTSSSGEHSRIGSAKGAHHNTP
jgi:hypothetical protein